VYKWKYIFVFYKTPEILVPSSMPTEKSIRSFLDDVRGCNKKGMYVLTLS